VTLARRGAALALPFVLLCLAAPVVSDASDFNLWGVEDVKAPAAWSVSRGAGVKVAVVDTGVMANHEELLGHVSGDSDVNGHGTAVAGVIAANPDNNKGIEGVAPDASIVSIRAFTDAGTQTAPDIVAALDRAGATGARIVNASFGTDPYQRRTGDFTAVENTLANHPDTLYVAAAGNEANDNDDHPVLPCNADAPNLICVGAYSRDRRPWDESNYGVESVDLLAPGVSIWAPKTPFSTSYGYFDGTSMSAAYVSGVAALLFAKVPRLTPEGAIGLLLSTTRQLASGGQARSATGGSPDAVAALQAAVVDSDRDGVYDVVDGCPSQAYPTVDGCTPPPEPTPTPTPAPTVMPTPTPTVVPTEHHDPVPQLRTLKTTVTRCKPHRTCKRSATVRLTPDRNARVSLRIDRQVCVKRRCRWSRILSTAVTAGTGGARVVVRGTHKRSLPLGLYRVVAVPSSAAGTGRSATRQFRVR
jgi:subtilisin family serine protease